MDPMLLLPVLLLPLVLAAFAAARTRRPRCPSGAAPARPAVATWNGQEPLWVWYRANVGRQAPPPVPWRPRPRAHA